MNLLAKHEIEHIAFCCDDNLSGWYIGRFYVEIDFDNQEVVVTRKKFGEGDLFCPPMEKIHYGDGNVKLIWVFFLDEKD